MKNTGEKVLITGGAGYLGSVLTPLLISEGYEVTVLDDFLFGQTTLLDSCINKKFTIIRGDCRNEKTLKEILKDKDYIIPLAAIVGYPLCAADEIAAKTTNVGAIKTLLKLRNKEQKIVFPCTNSGYGIMEGGNFCTEDSPLKPITLYGKTKVEAEKIVLETENSLSFRFATVFGASPRMRLDLLVNEFVYRAVHDRALIVFEGGFKRNYIHIRDAVNAILYAIKNFDKMKGLPYNCGLSTANLSKIELCQKIKEHLPNFTFLEAPLGEDPDKRNYLVSNERLEKAGWKPMYSLDDGIDELIKVFAIITHNNHSNI